MSDRLEILVGRALREAPLRRAPSSLESRVLREIGRRAAVYINREHAIEKVAAQYWKVLART